MPMANLYAKYMAQYLSCMLSLRSFVEFLSTWKMSCETSKFIMAIDCCACVQFVYMHSINFCTQISLYVRAAYFTCNHRLSAADVEACFREFDRDKDKKLSYDEFCVMMNTRWARSTVVAVLFIRLLCVNSFAGDTRWSCCWSTTPIQKIKTKITIKMTPRQWPHRRPLCQINISHPEDRVSNLHRTVKFPLDVNLVLSIFSLQNCLHIMDIPKLKVSVEQGTNDASNWSGG